MAKVEHNPRNEQANLLDSPMGTAFTSQRSTPEKGQKTAAPENDLGSIEPEGRVAQRESAPLTRGRFAGSIPAAPTILLSLLLLTACQEEPLVCRAIDGDTIACNEERIRLVGIDAPEVHGAKCTEEKLLGARAFTRLFILLGGGEIEIRREVGLLHVPRKLVSISFGSYAKYYFKKDKYGRTLARVLVDGKDVSEILIQEGLGRPYDGGQRGSWCEEVNG